MTGRDAEREGLVVTQRRQRVVTGLAVVVFVVAVPLLWQIGGHRMAAAAADQRADQLDNQVTARHAPADYDGDGIDDDADACPTRPETDNGFRDDDGCPDVVETTGAS